MSRTLYLLCALAFVSLFSACERDLLNPVPPTSVSDATAFDTRERVQNQVLALYAALKGGKFYGGRYVVYNDVRGEDFVNITTNNITAADIANLTVAGSSPSLMDLWARAYSTINQANLFIEGMDAKGTSVVGEATARQYIGEARLIRGLSFYSLLQLFANPYWKNNGADPGLPLRLTGIKGPGQSDLARSTVAEVYAQVLEDLNFAESALPLNYSTAILNTTRAHRNTAIALKTRVYLSMRNYSEVITEANKIVPASAPFVAPTGVAHRLEADITNVFKTPYTSVESIFSMPFSNNSADVAGTQNQLGTYFYNNGSVGSAEFALNPTGIIADPSWSGSDKRRDFIYTNTNPNNANFNRRFLSKFPSPSPYLDFVPVIRYAEVMLNLSEALARTNGLNARAIALLNAVRKRSDPAATLAPANQQELVNMLLTERRIEFLGEGLRNIDIMRLGLNLPARPGAQAISPGQPGYIFPISNNELIFNNLMTDN